MWDDFLFDFSRDRTFSSSCHPIGGCSIQPIHLVASWSLLKRTIHTSFLQDSVSNTWWPLCYKCFSYTVLILAVLFVSFPQSFCIFFFSKVSFWDRLSLSSLDWPWTWDPPACPCRALGLWACTATPSSLEPLIVLNQSSFYLYSFCQYDTQKDIAFLKREKFFSSVFCY